MSTRIVSLFSVTVVAALTAVSTWMLCSGDWEVTTGEVGQCHGNSVLRTVVTNGSILLMLAFCVLTVGYVIYFLGRSKS